MKLLCGAEMGVLHVEAVWTFGSAMVPEQLSAGLDSRNVVRSKATCLFDYSQSQLSLLCMPKYTAGGLKCRLDVSVVGMLANGVGGLFLNLYA